MAESGWEIAPQEEPPKRKKPGPKIMIEGKDVRLVVRLKEWQLAKIESLVKDGTYESKAELYRKAFEQFLSPPETTEPTIKPRIVEAIMEPITFEKMKIYHNWNFDEEPKDTEASDTDFIDRISSLSIKEDEKKYGWFARKVRQWLGIK